MENFPSILTWTVTVNRTAILLVSIVVAAVSQSFGQSVLERSPNLSGGWVGSEGTLHFNFLHRFDIFDRKVANFPTFLLALGLPQGTLVGVHYASNSQVVENLFNEVEFFGRYAPLSQESGAPLDVALQAGYNEGAESVDGELSLARRFNRVRLLAAGRVLSNGYDEGETRWALAGGASVRLTRHLAVAGDVASLLDKAGDEEVAWGAAVQLAIPFTPHTFSLQVTNTETGTIQGLSRGNGSDNVRYGFEFTIPVTLSRYFGRPTPAASRTEPAGPIVAASMQQFAFGPERIEVTTGTTVEWTNRDPVAHSVTAEDASWDSGLIEPGTTWRRTFDQAGTYPFHCTPHPFMKGVVVVR